ncbi:MAG: hypothetical protein GY765_33870 [bacterium]|nr:hypothetical protein [bacterium]
MIIKENVKEAHKQLSTCSFRFLESLVEMPELTDRSNFRALDGVAEGLKLQSWPTFIDASSKDQMEEAGQKVFDLLRQIPQRIFNNNTAKMSAYYQVPADVIAMQLEGTNPDHMKNLVARGDFLFTPSGLKCLEYNVSSSMGGMQVAYWQPMYVQIPMITNFLLKNKFKPLYRNVLAILLEHLLDNAGKMFPYAGGDGESGNEINIVMAFPDYGKKLRLRKQERYLEMLYREVRKHRPDKPGGSVVFCDYPDLDIKNGYLFHKGKKIHVLLEMYHGVVMPEIMEIFKDGNLCLFNGPITKFMSNKLNLALLSEYGESDIFSAEEKESIKRYIPWTRRITEGEVTYNGLTEKMEDFIFSHKDKMVIKPPMGMSGAGIHIGKNTPDDIWKKAVEQTFRERNWVLQEQVESCTYLYRSGANGYAEHSAAWGIFIFGSRYAGAFVRVLPNGNNNGVINSGQGAEDTPGIEVAPA